MGKKLLCILFLVAILGVTLSGPAAAHPADLSAGRYTVSGQEASPPSSPQVDHNPALPLPQTEPPCENKVLIDQGHRNAYDTDARYGNFTEFPDALAARAYQWQNGTSAFTSEALAGYDILVIPDARQAPTSAEIAAVHRWVRDGGGLFLIVEWGDRSGPSQALANVFDIVLDANKVTDPTDSPSNKAGDWVIYGTDNFPRHPILDNVNTLRTWTGGSIAPDPGFPLVVTDADADPPHRPVALALRYRAGRIVVVGDANLFDDTHGWELPDNRTFALNIMDWLANAGNPDFTTDEDEDGLSTRLERLGWWGALGTHHTNPCDPDSDDDGLSDGEEREYKLHPLVKVPAFTLDDDRGSYDEFTPYPDPPHREFKAQYLREQRWEMEAVTYTKSRMGMAVKGRLWGPTLWWDSRFHGDRRWTDWGGVELELYTDDLNYVNTGSAVYPEPNFHLLVETTLWDNLPVFEANVEADVDLDINWEFISAPSDLEFGDSGSNVQFTAQKVDTTLEAAFGAPGAFGTAWGLIADGEGNWGVKFGWFDLNFNPTKTEVDPGSHAPFIYDPRGRRVTQEFTYPRLVDFNTYWVFGGSDKYAHFHLITPLDIRSFGAPECTELLKMNLTGEVVWKYDGAFKTPTHEIIINHVDETMYAVIQSDAYAAGDCGNSVQRILASPQAVTRPGGQVHIRREAADKAQLDAADSGGDESFKDVSATPFDSDGDAQEDALTIAWDADTTAAQEEVLVVVSVENGAGATRYIYGPYPIDGQADDPRSLTYYSQTDGLHQITAGVLDAAHQPEDGAVMTATLAAGPGDPGAAHFTTVTPTITGQTATIAWTAATDLPQEEASIFIVVKDGDGLVETLTAGPMTLTNSQDVPGQAVFNAPANGRYEALVYLLDAESKVEDEALAPLAIGQPAIGLTGVYTDTLVETNPPHTDLQITAAVDLGVSSEEYLLEGGLYDSSDALIEQTHQVITAAPGLRQVELQFDGLTIYRHGQPGPYTLKDVRLRDAAGVQVAGAAQPYTTAAYSLAMFGVPAASLTGSYTDRPVDANTDGLYETLTFDIGLDVVRAGLFEIQASLFDAGHNPVDSTVAFETLEQGAQTLTVSFPGAAIRARQANGPYTLGWLELRGPGGGQPIDWRSRDAYTTGPYAAGDFQPLGAILTGQYSDSGLDTTQNGLSNYLVINAGVEVAVAGQYQVEGVLLDSQGKPVPWSNSAWYTLEPGRHTFQIPFDGVNIQAPGGDSVFSLTKINLLDASRALLDEQSNAYTTASYPYNQFEPGRNSAVIALLDDDMESGPDNWQAGSPWALTTADSHSATHAWTDSPAGDYANNADAILTSMTIDLSEAPDPFLSFWTRYEFDRGDHGAVEFSTDNGQTWEKLISLNAASDWRQEYLDLIFFAGEPNLLIRFRLISNESGTADGWYIDDVKVARPGVPQPQQQPPPLPSPTPQSPPQHWQYLPVILK